MDDDSPQNSTFAERHAARLKRVGSGDALNKAVTVPDPALAPPPDDVPAPKTKSPRSTGAK
jgi:hypothetical protein